MHGAFELPQSLAPPEYVPGAHPSGEPANRAQLQRRADQGDPDAACRLGWLLVGRGDEDAALVAWERADELGSATGGYLLAGLLLKRDERKQALAALRRADRRGSAEAAVQLGKIQAQRGTVVARAGAAAAYRRARARGSAEAAELLEALPQSLVTRIMRRLSRARDEP